jgi:hypothetical protein
MPTINWLAVIIATVASFAIGAVWYSPADSTHKGP